jgi:hypothetical protein
MEHQIVAFGGEGGNRLKRGEARKEVGFSWAKSAESLENKGVELLLGARNTKEYARIRKESGYAEGTP